MQDESDGRYYVNGGTAVELFSKSGEFCFVLCLFVIYMDDNMYEMWGGGIEGDSNVLF